MNLLITTIIILYWVLAVPLRDLRNYLHIGPYDNNYLSKMLNCALCSGFWIAITALIITHDIYVCMAPFIADTYINITNKLKQE